MPKDKRFVIRHAKAFKPTTALGYLALGGALGYTTSAALLLSTVTLGMSMAGLSMLLMAVMSMGTFVVVALGFLAFVLLSTAFVVGAVALASVSSYAVASSSLAVMHYIMGIVFGSSSSSGAAAVAAREHHHQVHEDAKEKENQFLDKSTTTVTPPTHTHTSGRPSTYSTPQIVLPPIKTPSPIGAMPPSTSSSRTAATAMQHPKAAPAAPIHVNNDEDAVVVVESVKINAKTEEKLNTPVNTTSSSVKGMETKKPSSANSTATDVVAACLDSVDQTRPEEEEGAQSTLSTGEKPIKKKRNRKKKNKSISASGTPTSTTTTTSNINSPPTSPSQPPPPPLLPPLSPSSSSSPPRNCDVGPVSGSFEQVMQAWQEIEQASILRIGAIKKKEMKKVMPDAKSVVVPPTP